MNSGLLLRTVPNNPELIKHMFIPRFKSSSYNVHKCYINLDKQMFCAFFNETWYGKKAICSCVIEMIS